MRCVQQENLSYVLVQGAPFPHLPSFLLSFKVLWSFPLGDPPIVPTPWYSLTIPHIRAGGVLTGVWFFGSNTPFHQSSLRARPKQRLRHIIHTAFRGVRLREAPPPCQEHDMQEDEVIRWSGINTLDWDSCPIPNRADLLVHYPSTFMKSWWTVRQLTNQELGADYDVPQHILSRLGDEHSPFIMATPAKTLTGALECWLPLETPLPKKREGIEEGLQSTTLTLLQVVSETIFIPQERGQTCGDFDKAVKSDNAEAIYSLWDRRMWDLQLHSEQSYQRYKDFILNSARGSFISPLDVLRSAFLCIWRKRVSRCLRRYLQTKHGAKF
jgi:hypothetical protein